MRYWYFKGPWVSGHGDFHGSREFIYRGEITPKEFLSRFQDDIEDSPKEWKINWKEIKKYNPAYIPHTAEGMTEITEEEFKKIISSKGGS